ncbi:hypothetical protein HMPREF1557_00313 [Streptococcus sobrinus W1703]|uniref:Uncharacterized protein n=1 Tax=Streptococcus sobrinus W1703 TaxID=1227275 RepID=U2KTY0_9STRE|nr:hypothetical protein HMPREF1557_00313 [Streptococcus sobrinus W1703]
MTKLYLSRIEPDFLLIKLGKALIQGNKSLVRQCSSPVWKKSR